MALYQPTNVIPSTFSNTGAVDVNKPMEISWQVNGNQDLQAFQIDFYKNDTASTFIASTGIIGLTNKLSENAPEQAAYNLPFSGKSGTGIPQFYTYAPKNDDGTPKTWKQFNGKFTDLTDGINLANSYKYKITQWYEQFGSFYQGISTISTFQANTWYYGATRADDGTPNSNFWGFYIDSTLAVRIKEQVRAYFNNTTGTGFLIGNTTNILYIVPAKYVNQSSTPDGWIDTGATMTLTSEFYTYTSPIESNVFYSAPIYVPNMYTHPSTGGFGDPSGNHSYNRMTYIGILSFIGVLPVSSVRWELAYQNGNEIGDIIVDTGFIDTHTMRFNYAGFQDDQSYAIRLTIKQDVAIGATQIVSTRWYKFNINFNHYPFKGKLTAQPICKEDCVLLEWETTNTIFTDYRIFRQCLGDREPLQIATIPTSINTLKDYGVTSGRAYKYSIYGDIVNDSYTSIVVADNAVTTCFKNYSLLVCDYDEENDEYHVRKQYLFALNLSTGSVGNNNSPTLNANFTRYPTRMPSTQNYASGTLQGLIGAIYTVPALIEQIGNYKWTAKPSTLDYFDSVDLEQELYDLSTAPYQLFLRDMKGRLRMIATNGAVTMTTNIKQKQQSISISFPWVEIGDASDVTIIQTPDDYGWNNDNQVLDVSLDVDVETGELSATYPYPYKGTKFYLTGVNKETLTAKTPLGVTPAQFDLSEVAEEPNDGELTATVKLNSEDN